MIADKNMKISRDYGVLIEEDGVALRGLFLIDPKGTLRYASASLCGVSALSDNGPIASRQITINDLPVGRSVEETIRLVKAFQFTVRRERASINQFSPSDYELPGRARRGLPRELERGLQDDEGGPQGLARVLCERRRQRRERECEQEACPC